jgi:hypothetical protein
MTGFSSILMLLPREILLTLYEIFWSRMELIIILLR